MIFLSVILNFFDHYTKRKVAEAKQGQFFSYLQSRLSFRVLHSVNLNDSASVHFVFSVCLYKLLGATAVAERALARIRFDNRYTGQNEMYRC